MSKPEWMEGMTDAEVVLDRLRGSPQRRLGEYAAGIDMTYQGLIEYLKAYVESNGNEMEIEYNNEHKRDSWYDGLWDDFELMTGITVPQDIRYSPFSCSC